VIRDHSQVHPLLRDAVMSSMYVDDCLVSVRTLDDATVILDGLPELLRTGGFVLTKFVANDQQLVKGIPSEHTAKEVHDFSQESVGRVLGVLWNVFADVFLYVIECPEASSLTRRFMLKFVSSVFDPLGLSAPWVLPGRLIFQAATRLGLGWDDPVDGNLSAKW
jgi:hypothetical protein